MPFNETSEQQLHLFEQAMQTPDGRMFVAQRLMDPIRQERDYVSMGRQGFILDPLAQGEVPYYDVDIKTRAVVLPMRGEVPQERINVQRVEVPIFPLASYPLIPIIDTKMRRYNAIDRVQAKTRADLAEEEDRCIFGDPLGNPATDGGTNYGTTYGSQNVGARQGISVYRAATPTTTGEIPTGSTTAGLGPGTTSALSASWEDAFDHLPNAVSSSNLGVTKEVMLGAFQEILVHDLIPSAFLFNPRDFVDIYTWGRDEVDPETQKEILETGRMGKIWNCELLMSKIVPQGTFYVRTSDYYLGVMPILIDLDVLDAPDPRGLNYGYVFYEFLGMAILNAWGVARGQISRSGL